MARNIEQMTADIKASAALDLIEKRRKAALDTATQRTHAKYDKQRTKALSVASQELAEALLDEPDHLAYTHRLKEQIEFDGMAEELASE